HGIGPPGADVLHAFFLVALAAVPPDWNKASTNARAPEAWATGPGGGSTVSFDQSIPSLFVVTSQRPPVAWNIGSRKWTTAGHKRATCPKLGRPHDRLRLCPPEREQLCSQASMSPGLRFRRAAPAPRAHRGGRRRGRGRRWRPPAWHVPDA